MKLKTLRMIFLAGAAVMASLPALAQDKANPCLPDVEKLCKGIPAAGGRVMKCLNDNEAKLSGECRKTLGLVKVEWAACRDDAEKLCRNAAGDKGGLSKCLVDHENKVTAPCKSAMDEARERMDKNHPCLRDSQKFCKNVQPGEGRVLACLKGHQAELATACKTLVQSKP
jgi:hypothetical protein